MHKIDPIWTKRVNRAVAKIENLKGLDASRPTGGAIAKRGKSRHRTRGGSSPARSENIGTRQGQGHMMITDNTQGWNFPETHG